jgi:hypothetical protein
LNLPAYAAWRHLGTREGFEVVFFRRDADGYTAIGQANAVEDGLAWALHYRISFDSTWVTRKARINSICGDHDSALEIATNGRGEWYLGGAYAPQLNGCLDLDLEASVFTNALPVHRLQLRVQELARAPAVYVRMPTLRVERLRQTYQRLRGGVAGTQSYAYSAPAFNFSAELSYDSYGLLLDYPGIGTRVA